MASALFLGSWAVMMGPLIYGKRFTLYRLVAPLPYQASQPHLIIAAIRSSLRSPWRRRLRLVKLHQRCRIPCTSPEVHTKLTRQNSAPSGIPRTATFHGHILRQHCADAVLCGWCKSSSISFGSFRRRLPQHHQPPPTIIVRNCVNNIFVRLRRRSCGPRMSFSLLVS